MEEMSFVHGDFKEHHIFSYLKGDCRLMSRCNFPEHRRSPETMLNNFELSEFISQLKLNHSVNNTGSQSK